MNILTRGADPEDIDLCCGGALIKAARVGPNVSTNALTAAGKSGDPEQRRGICESVKVIRARRRGIDNLEDTSLITRSNHVNHSEFSFDVPIHTEEYYR